MRNEEFIKQHQTFIIKEINLKDGCRHERHFRFRCTEYRDVVSLNSFFFGTSRRNYKPSYAKGQYLYYAVSQFDYDADQERVKKYNLQWKGGIVDLTSIWAFYKDIGYDYKNKKWIPV